MKRVLLSVTALLSCYGGWSQPSVIELLQRAEAYYSSLRNISFTIQQRSKTAISTDTITYTYPCVLQNVNGEKILGQLADSNTLIIYRGEGSYYLYPSRQELFHNNSRQNDPEERLAQVPYWRPMFIFEKLVKEITAVNTTLRNRPEGGFEISGFLPSGFYLIEMDSMYRIRRFRQIIPTELGTQVKDTRFFEHGQAATSLINQLEHAQQQYTNITNRKIKRKRVEDVAGEQVNMDSLLRLLNLPAYNKTNLYFDFFYKDCYPCIQSIAKVNEVHQLVADSVLKVYGIDSRKEDEGNWDKFRARYKMIYPVVDGARAAQIQALLLKDVHFGWPVNILVSPQGKIIYAHEGYEKKLLKRVEKVLQK